MAVGVVAAASGGGEATKAVGGIAVQHDLAVELPAGPGEDCDRVPTCAAGTFVESMAAVALQVIVAAIGFEGPAEELFARGGVLGDKQNRADRSGTREGPVEVGQASAVGGGVAVGAVAAIGDAAGVGAGQCTSKDSTAAALGIALGNGAAGGGALDQEPEVGGINWMAELPGVAPAVGGGIGMAAHH